MNKDFEKLKSEWYGKLADSGFVDIEVGDRFRGGSSASKAAKYAKIPGRAALYSFASKYLHDLPSGTPLLDKMLWFAFSEGHRREDVMKALNLSRSKVMDTWSRMKKDMIKWMETQIDDDDVY